MSKKRMLSEFGRKMTKLLADQNTHVEKTDKKWYLGVSVDLSVDLMVSLSTPIHTSSPKNVVNMIYIKYGIQVL